MNVSVTPRDQYPELFELVQSRHVFGDSKTFVDALPRESPEAINRDFRRHSGDAGFDIEAFVRERFALPSDTGPADAGAVAQAPIEAHLEALWEMLLRDADDASDASSLIPLPNPYVVPGGRFREIYYWDSYFTMLGLAESGHVDRIGDMVDNFAYLIDTIGFIPNGNRSYYCSRSQPPFFALMVELLESVSDAPGTAARYQPQLLAEYRFWMRGEQDLADGEGTSARVVASADGMLNRYWDDDATPRQESHAEDTALAESIDRDAADLYRNVRAACESGWDFSSRWLADGKTLGSIHTVDVVPVDLNVLMYCLERRISNNFATLGERDDAEEFERRASQRRDLVRSRFFDPEQGIFTDLLLPDLVPSRRISLAAAYPLAFGIATPEQSGATAKKLIGDFLQPGGWVTSLSRTGQQWDWPNGWAPLQWIVFEALLKNGYESDAREGARRWVETCRLVYEQTGRMLEKYDVVSPGRAGGGGEYAVQDGFGWTNGVYLGLMRELADG